MNLLKRFVVLLLFMVAAFSSGRAMNLRVMSPWNTGVTYPGSITDFRMTVRPQGTFMELGMYVTFSSKGSPYTSAWDSVEATFEFDLPQRSFINDSWLFFSDTTYVRAKLVDKWTASFIYEDIVHRQRRDPSVLYKLSEGKYKLKVFPVPGNSTRTVKINCFVPAVWGDSLVTAKLPFDISGVSSQKLEAISVYAYTDTAFSAPRIMGNERVKFIDTVNPRHGQSKLTIINGNDFATSNVIGYRHIFDKGVFANYTTDQKENSYQLVVDTKGNAFDVAPKRIAFLVDYDPRKSDYKPIEIINTIKQSIKKNMNPVDSFNIFLSKSGLPVQVADKWMPADTGTVESIFRNINPDTLGTTSNLYNLLYMGTRWVVRNSEDAIILLIADTDQNGQRDSANKIGEMMTGMMGKGINFSVCSFAEFNLVANSIAGIIYAGNDYLYVTMVQKSRGLFNKIHGFGYDLGKLIDGTINSLLGGYESVNIIPQLIDGHTYDQINSYNQPDIKSDDRYIVEYGKYVGEFPKQFFITGYYRKVPFFTPVIIERNNLSNRYDNLSIWASASIRNMEKSSSPANMMIYDIINKSLEYRVLSVYTSFLALETDKRDTIARDDDVVPVELMYFNGYAREKGIDLLWATASETNNYGFYIERRVQGDATKWETIGFVAGAGDSKTIRNYNYFDGEVAPNNTYQYWLRQVDKDGTSTSGTKIITVKYDASFNLTLEQNYPNPVNKETKIVFTLPSENYTKVEIVDMMGNVVKVLMEGRMAANRYEAFWDGRDCRGEMLPNGTYLCKLTSGGETRVIKMMVSR